jgi:hypothetical protein
VGVNENRRNAAQYVGAGGALLAVGAGGNELLNARLKHRMPGVKHPGVMASAGRSLAGKPHGFSSSVHVPHMAGKAGVRGVQLSALPLLAAGAKRFVTGEDTRKLSVSSDVVRPVVEHATYQDQVKRGDKHISKAAYDPFSRSWTPSKKLLTSLNREKARDVRTGAGAQKFVAENRQLASLSHGNKLEVISPTSPAHRLRYVIPHQVYRYNPRGEAEGFKKSLSESDTKRLDRHKKAGTLLSLSSGTLGLAALGTRAPAVARAAGNKGVKGLSRLASHEAKATSLSNTLGVGAIGVGSAGSFNYAAQQKLERKRDAVVKGMPTYGWLKRTGEKVRIMRPHGTSGHFLVDSPRGTLITHRDDMRFATAKQTRLSPESPRAAAARAKQPEQLSMFEKSFLSRYGDRISPNAEAGYRHLRSERNENVASAIGNTSLAGLSAGVLAHEGHTLSKPAAALTGAGGLAAAYTALHSTRTAKRRQTSMKKIEQKAHARAALGLYGPDRGKTPVDMSSARAKKTGAAS